jgi:hypothetical protein
MHRSPRARAACNRADWTSIGGRDPWVSLGALPVSWLAVELQARVLFMLKPVSYQDGSVRVSSFSGTLLVCPRYALTSALFVEGLCRS